MTKEELETEIRALTRQYDEKAELADRLSKESYEASLAASNLWFKINDAQKEVRRLDELDGWYD